MSSTWPPVPPEADEDAGWTPPPGTTNDYGYMVIGDDSRPNPAAMIIDAVAKGDIDVALVWGPPAGYFSRTSSVPLRIEPMSASRLSPIIP